MARASRQSRCTSLRQHRLALEALEPRLVLDSTVVFNEVMYNPAGPTDEALEWVELHNQMAVDMDISKWQIEGGIDYQFPEGTVVPGGGYLVIAADPAAFEIASGYGDTLGPFSGQLANGGETLRLVTRTDRTMDRLDYGDNGDWPVAPDGSGVTLAKIDPDMASEPAANWLASFEMGGTPGEQNFSTSYLPNVVFNEIHSATDAQFFVEIANLDDENIDLNGYVLSVDGDPLREHVLTGPTLAPGEIHDLDAEALGLSVTAGDPLFLYHPGKLTVADARVVTGRLRGRIPSGDGSWLFPSSPTPGTANAFDLQTDVVINEIMYHHRPQNDGVFAEIPEEWIELYNRGTQDVNLSGWKLDGGVDFEFPLGTILAANEYLVIANDAAALALKYPAIDVVGQYSGGLSNSGELIVLEDALGNPADEVHYYEDGRWPKEADGGGASLELRDPNADNSSSVSWSASNEAANSIWAHYSYEGVAQASSVGPDGQWNEFVMGLLTRGEVLLDNLSVVSDPNGAATEMIINGSFESDTPGGDAADWRIIGNHRHSEVIVDPDDAANQVLRFVATGPTEHMHNHAETSLTQAIQNGVTYRISYDAKWISGSNQLNSRLYFNRLPKTTFITQPAMHGTPGAQNSTYVANAGPTYKDLVHSPAVPAPAEPVTVSVNATDPNDVMTMTLYYSVESGLWMNVSMAHSAGRYSRTIPGQVAGDIVQFYVEGVDDLGATSTFPREGEDSRSLYQVDDGLATTGGLHNLRIILTPDDASYLHTDINLMSNDRVGATVIYDEQEVFYDVGVRLSGSQRARPITARVAFGVGFNSDQLFRGVHQSITLDRSQSTGFGQQELLTHHVSGHAGVVPAEYNDLIHIVTPQAAHTGSAELQLARFTDVFLESQFEGGEDGRLFEYELVYYPTTADAQGNKRPNPDSVRGVAITDLGDDPERYRQTFLIKSNRDADDYTHAIEWAKTMGLTGAAFNDQIGDVIDVDQWLQAFAWSTTSGAGDNFTMGSQHNAQFYIRPEDNRVLYFPHDLDAFLSTTRPLVGNATLSKLISVPERARTYYGHMHDILSTTYNQSYMQYWTNNFGSLLPAQNFTAHLAFINSRSIFLLGQVNAAVAPIDFDITTNDFTVDTITTTLAGTGWVNVREIRLAGSSVPLTTTWSQVADWEVVVPLDFGDTVVTIEAYDFQGELIDADTITINSTAADPRIRDALRITEVNYNPQEMSASEALAGITDNDQFEFIEITNVSDTQVNLAGVQLIDGVGYAFGNIDLPAGQQIVVVRDLTAFQERYGADGIMIAGTWDPDISGGKLSNGGEDVVLIDAVGTIVHDFKYDNSGSWPGRADGKGSTLEVLDTSGDYNDPDNWRSSGEFNGSPGEEGQGLDRRVVINELLTHTDPPQTDTIELLNTTDAPIDVGGWYLSDNNNRYNKFRIPNGTIIAARGYLVFDENDFNVSLGVDPNDFALNGAHGDDVYLLSGDASDNVLDFIDHVEVGAALNGISYGRWPDETSRLVPMQWNSFGRENAYPVMPDLMISEIHYNPAHATPRAWTKQAGNWQLTGGHLESSGDPTGSVNYLATVDAEQTDVRVDVTVNFPEELNSAPAYGLFDMDASGIIGRYNSSFDFVVTGIRQFSGEVGVWKYAGIWTEVVTPVAIPGGVVVGDDYRLSATFDGTMITVSVNGFELISADTSVNTIGAQFGLRALSEGDQFDDFLVTPFDGSPLTTDSFSRDSTSGLGMTDELGNDLEFVEIYNASDATIDLTGWRLRKGIDYDFVEPGASAVSLDAGETIVVLSFNPADPLNADRTAQFRSGHEIDASVVLVGGYGGKLGNNGESIELQRPDMPPLLEPDFTPHIVTDRVVYEAVAPWPDVLISFESLNRTSIDTFGHESASWQASAPTPGSAVMNVAAPRVVGVGAGGPVYGTSQVIEASAAGITTLEIYFNAPQFLLGPTRVLDGAIQLDDNGQSGSGTYRQFDLDAAAMHRWLEVTTGGGLPVESLFVGQLLGDLDGDHAIGAGDLSRLFGSATSTDITGDGITNAADLAQILAMWGDALPEIPLGDPAISDIATEVIDAALVELSTEPAVMGPLPTLIVQPIGPQEVSSFSRLRTRRTLRPELPDEPTTRLARRRRLLRSAVDVVIEEDTFRRWR